MTGRQAVSALPSNSTSSQTGSEATTNTHARESPFQAGNNLPSSQEGSQVTTRSGRHSSRCSVRHRALQASQGNSAASQADSTDSWEDNPTPTPPIGSPKGLPQKILTQSGSSTCPANL